MAKNSLVNQVRELIQSMPSDLNIDVITSKKAKIIEISEQAKKELLYKKSEKQRDNFYAPLMNVSHEKAILMSWVHFMDRAANAPSVLHLHGVVVVCFPIIGDLLRGKK